MLTNDEFAKWCKDLGLTEEVKQEIATIRTSPPSRLVHSRHGNVPCRYPSDKMGHTIQAESHKVELPFAHMLEHDPDVLEYWDQPAPITLDYFSKTGRHVVVSHTADYFVMRTSSAGWVECKPEERLLQLQDESPTRYVHDEQDGWRCPPGADYADARGLTYTLWSSANINWAEQRNWAYLADYMRGNPLRVQPAVLHMIKALVESHPGLTLAELQSNVRPSASADDINLMILHQQIFVDMKTYILAEPDYAPVYIDQATAQAFAISDTTIIQRSPLREAPQTHTVSLKAGAAILWDGIPWTIANVSEEKLTLLNADGTPIDLKMVRFEDYVRAGRIIGKPPPLGSERSETTSEGISKAAAADAILAQASKRDLQKATRRFSLIQAFLQERAPLSSVPGATQRQQYRWVESYRRAERTHGNGFVGLLPQYPAKPPRGRILSEAHLALIHTALDEHWVTYRNKKLMRAYEAYVLKCGQVQPIIQATSTKTFYIEAHHYLAKYDLTRAQGGPRAAYRYKQPYLENPARYSGPRHGELPWDCAYLDHTQVDIELRSSRSDRHLGRAWLTMFVEGKTRRILSLFLSYSPPSYVSCMMALRLCVQRWGRLPRIIVVDGGKEFHSVYFETLLAWYGITLKTRPPSEPRYGAVGERLFGTSNTQFTHTLLGNTQLMKNPRSVSTSVNPRTHTHWTLGSLHTWLQEWAFETYDTADHVTLGMSPREAYTWEQSRSGARPQTLIPYDRDFVLRTLPTTRKGTAVVVPGYGVKINTFYYWSQLFANPRVERTSVDVRYDPFDMGIAYAYLPELRQWADLRSEHYAALHQRSERECQIIAEEIRQQNTDHSRRVILTAKHYADFQERVMQHEQLLTQHDSDIREKLLLQEDRDMEVRELAQLSTAGLLTLASAEVQEISVIGSPLDSHRPANTQPSSIGMSAGGISDVSTGPNASTDITLKPTSGGEEDGDKKKQEEFPPLRILPRLR